MDRISFKRSQANQGPFWPRARTRRNESKSKREKRGDGQTRGRGEVVRACTAWDVSAKTAGEKWWQLRHKVIARHESFSRRLDLGGPLGLTHTHTHTHACARTHQATRPNIRKRVNANLPGLRVYNTYTRLLILF